MATIRKFIQYYKPHRKLFFADMVCAFIVAVTGLFYPMIAKNMINDYVPNRNLRLLLIWGGVLLAIYLLKAGLNWFIQYYGHIVGVRIQADMRRDIFHRLQKLPFSFFDEHKTGSIMSPDRQRFDGYLRIGASRAGRPFPVHYHADWRLYHALHHQHSADTDHFCISPVYGLVFGIDSPGDECSVYPGKGGDGGDQCGTGKFHCGDPRLPVLYLRQP